MKAKYTSGIIVAIVIICGLATWLFMSGRLVWSVNGGQHVVAQAVCDSTIVSKYNDAMFVTQRSGSDVSSIDESGVKAVKTDIKAKAGYEKDATCQALLFFIAINDSDYPSAKSAYQEVKQLHSNGIFPDNNIRGSDALFNYQNLLNGIDPNIKGPIGE